MSERIPFQGDSKREKPIYEADALGPWGARVRVTPIRTGARVRFEIAASWRGPSLVMSPGGGQVAEVTDSTLVNEPELAREIAQRAADALRAGRVPHLTELLQANRPGP